MPPATAFICSSSAMPSMVVTWWPTASMASVMQLLTGILSSHTVQLEHTPRSQLILVPVMLSWMRSASASVVRGSIIACVPCR